MWGHRGHRGWGCLGLQPVGLLVRPSPGFSAGERGHQDGIREGGKRPNCSVCDLIPIESSQKDGIFSMIF